NLLVSFTGSVKITDFGIARARGRSTSTTSGTLKGKFPYMSYEMVKGMEIDARSDIFSLGIVMWEMLTYRRLFKRDTEVASINAILNEEIPSPKKYFKNLPDGVEKIVMKALERDRDKRFQTAREMGNAIEDFISQKRVTVRISDLSDYLTELFPDRGISGDKKLTSSKIDKIVEIKEHKSASNSLPVITIQKKNPVGENGTVVLPPPTLEIKPEPEGGIDGNQEIEKKGEEISSDSNVKPLPKVIEEMEIGGHYVQEDKISNRHNEGTKSESLEVAREVIATTPSNKQSGKRNLLIAAVLMSLVLLVGVIFFVLNLGKRDEAVLNTTPKLLKEEGEKKASGIGEKEVVEERKEMGDAERSEVEKEKMEQSIEEKNRKAETVRKKEQKVASVERPKIQENVKKVEKMEEEGTEQEVKTSAIEPKKGFLSIDSDPWTEVYLDGKKIGDTPLVKYELIAGSYNLILKNSEFGFEKPLRVNINPEENSVSKVRFKKGFLNIETNRPAEVRIGGNLIGRTPLSNLDLYEGIYKITLFDPEQKRSKTIKVEIKEGKITSINENL
ncbi:MAG: protein kinase domain-containing protein, partial [Myxococcota bacterium]